MTYNRNKNAEPVFDRIDDFLHDPKHGKLRKIMGGAATALVATAGVAGINSLHSSDDVRLQSIEHAFDKAVNEGQSTFMIPERDDGAREHLAQLHGSEISVDVDTIRSLPTVDGKKLNENELGASGDVVIFENPIVLENDPTAEHPEAQGNTQYIAVQKTKGDWVFAPVETSKDNTNTIDASMYLVKDENNKAIKGSDQIEPETTHLKTVQ